ncbi:sigma-54 dependent transcriptional regulator [Comamonas faecalis]
MVLTLAWGVGDAQPLLQAMRDCGLQPIVVNTVGEAQQALREHAIACGMVLGPDQPLPGASASCSANEAGETPHAVHWARLEDTLSEIRQHSALEWVACCAPDALQSLQLRALLMECFFDFFAYPPDWPEVAQVLRHIGKRCALRQSLRRDLQAAQTPHVGIVGQSPPIKQLHKQLRKVAQTDAPVLLFGESGSGKELAARAIHRQSSRKNELFVALNCAAIAPSLIQSELFGYEKGAFTGANARKQGLIEAADGGTLFLDEIADLPLDLQGNLLRFLQEKTINRLGGLESLSVDVRVISASHTQLERAVHEGRFREDLFYRLNVLPLTVPALRERGDDVLLLAEHFLQAGRGHRTGRLQGFSHNALMAMKNYEWPGNVRELSNRVQRAVVMGESSWISASDLGLSMPERTQVRALEQARAKAERELLEHTLNMAERNVTRAARDLGVSRMTLYRLIDKHGLILQE